MITSCALTGILWPSKCSTTPTSAGKVPEVDGAQEEADADATDAVAAAMKRELHEETSIKSIQIIKELDEWFQYELPKNLVGIIWKGKFRGQKQKWFVVKFTGEESEINLKTEHPEFIEWKWVEMDELPKIIVDFKKDVYEKLLLELKKFIY